jgi:hypothetical protein
MELVCMICGFYGDYRQWILLGWLVIEDGVNILHSQTLSTSPGCDVMSDMAAHFICDQNTLLELSVLSKYGLPEEKWMESGIVTVCLL